MCTLVGAHGSQERAQDSLELELQTLVSWELNKVLWKGQLMLLINELSLFKGVLLCELNLRAVFS